MDWFLVAIPAAPLASFALLILAWGATRWGDRDSSSAWRRAAGPLSALATAVALTVALAAFLLVRSGQTPMLETTWASVGRLAITFALRADGLQVVMAIVVSGVSLLVQLFSIGYMHGERDYLLYFAEVSLFTASMLLLVLSTDFFFTYLAWELVGATSYLLISFYYERPAAPRAGVKAFLTTRTGDVGLLIGIFAIFVLTGSLRYDDVFRAAASGGLGAFWTTAVPLLLFAGAAGKSAQVPLQVWLPDAMEGPTPVSALIHAATMVAAGVYLVARTFPLFAASGAALTVVAWIGALSALLGATVAVTQRDIKRVLAYSTISQLGFMMAALGAGNPEAGIFHLFTHAWFKALLFLGAGSVIHATGHQVIDDLSGLVRRMPVTAWTFTIGALALSGIPPFAGFWSKDEIFAVVARTQPAVLVVLLVATFLTAFYIFRVVLLVFFGPLRVGPASRPPAGTGPGTADVQESGAQAHGVHESGPVMLVPLTLLALGATVAGLAGASFLGSRLQGFLQLQPAAGAEAHAAAWISVVAGVIAVSGVALAVLAYRGPEPRTRLDGALRRRLGPAYRLAEDGLGLRRLLRAHGRRALSPGGRLPRRSGRPTGHRPVLRRDRRVLGVSGEPGATVADRGAARLPGDGRPGCVGGGRRALEDALGGPG